MGKGKIISHIDDGLYRVQLIYKDDYFSASVASLTDQLAHYDSIIAEMEEGTAKNLKILERLAIQKRIDFLNNDFPDNETVTAWIADHTIDLSTDLYVGTVEIPTETGRLATMIQPGYESGAEFDSSRDGQMNPTLNIPASGNYLSWAILPGWQKFMPTYRYGTITEIYDNKCTVTLESAFSNSVYAQQLNVNRFTELTNVTFDYMMMMYL